jgi:hypothetical protein
VRDGAPYGEELVGDDRFQGGDVRRLDDGLPVRAGDKQRCDNGGADGSPAGGIIGGIDHLRPLR